MESRQEIPYESILPLDCKIPQLLQDTNGNSDQDIFSLKWILNIATNINDVLHSSREK